MWTLCLCVCVLVHCGVGDEAKDAPTDCTNCDVQIVSVDKDFNKLQSNPELKNYVQEIVARLKTFKVPVHPRTRIFYELLKIAMNQYAHRTADSLFVPDKYNVAATPANNTPKNR